MALNKYMHHRNIYKIPPDFEKLSKSFQEFSSISKTDVTGKITIDFKDPHSLRVLTKCLLKSDFNLDVEIPADRLVPTLPLRLNYILWIEDLMVSIQRKLDIRGIDIGTGACAVYPLLASVKNKWHMLATETDQISLLKAQENVQRNHLEHLIELRDNKGSKLIENLFTEETNKFDFCMCNPPFYSSLQELYESRSPARLPPKNGFTGSPQELITEGGELKFCRQLIDESKRCKDNVLIFTTMVGHKYNLAELLQDLKADGVKHTHTEFCQGRVTRWGLAWTYQDYDLYHLVPPRDKTRKKNAPITHQLPLLPNFDYNIETAYNKIKSILTDLQIEQKILNKCGNRISLHITASENTWSNQRRKRRLMKRIEATNAKKLKSNDDSVSNTDSSKAKTNKNEEKYNKDNASNRSTEESINISELQSNAEKSINAKISENSQDTESPSVVKPSEAELSNVESSKTNTVVASMPQTSNVNNTAVIEPLVHAFMKLYKKDDNIQLEIELINGTGGKESVYQVIQYIKNNWK